MPDPKTRDFELDAIRTDGWFERIGEGIGSFQALCEIIGERFFAFSIIVGARITALTVDRRNPELSLVDFVVGAMWIDAPSSRIFASASCASWSGLGPVAGVGIHCSTAPNEAPPHGGGPSKQVMS